VHGTRTAAQMRELALALALALALGFDQAAAAANRGWLPQ
jgi:hypothetical protein